MSPGVTLPYWLFIPMALLSAWAVLVFFLVPGMRWYFLRRSNAVAQELKARFNLRLPDSKLTRRRALIALLTHDSKVVEAAQREIDAHPDQRGAIEARVETYAREIVPAFSPYLYYRFGYWLARRASTFLYRVRLGYVDTDALSKIDQSASVVFVSNHRSNMDYILVAFLAAERTALSYAVGEWARVWPLQTLIRSLGAFFVRRNSGDALYRTVLQRYVQTATQLGVCQAMFPEGGLSRDGRLRAPKMGLVDYLTKSFEPQRQRDVVFVPVAINYDRVLEDRTLLLSLDQAAPKPNALFAAKRTLGFVLRNLRLMLKGRWYRLGYACVNFGQPLSLRDYVTQRQLDFPALEAAQRQQEVERLTQHLMQSVANIVPVIPVPLVATVFLRENGKQLSELELKAKALELVQELEARGAHIYVPRRDLDYLIGAGLRMLKLRRMVLEEDGLLRANPAEQSLLSYYANSIAHFFVSGSGAR